MPSGFDVNDSLFINLRPYIMIPLCHIGQGTQYIEPCNGLGRTLDAVDFSGNAVPDLAEQIIFQTLQLIFGIQDGILQLLKLRIRITLRIR